MLLVHQGGRQGAGRSGVEEQRECSQSIIIIMIISIITSMIINILLPRHHVHHVAGHLCQTPTTRTASSHQNQDHIDRSTWRHTDFIKRFTHSFLHRPALVTLRIILPSFPLKVKQWDHTDNEIIAAAKKIAYLMAHLR